MSRALLLLPLLASGCLTLDAFLFNGVPCTEVGPETCQEVDDPWGKLCKTCEQPYDWQRDYPWMKGTLAAGESIRPVPEELVQQHRVPTDDGEGELDVWFLRSHGEVPRLSTTTVLYNHGNYAGIEHYQPRARMLYEAGYNVLIWDYRGYGKTTPHEPPTPEQFMDDARTVRRWAREVVPDEQRVVIYGYSLGGLPAVEMAKASPGCALVLEAPFATFEEAVHTHTSLSIGERFFSEGRFDNVGKVANLRSPLFVMVGSDDATTPEQSARAVFEAAPEPKELWVLDGVAHGIRGGGVPEAGLSTYLDRIEAFLDAKATRCVLEL